MLAVHALPKVVGNQRVLERGQAFVAGTEPFIGRSGEKVEGSRTRWSETECVCF